MPRCDPNAKAEHIPWALRQAPGEDPVVCPTHGVPGFMGVFSMGEICPAGWFLLGGPDAEPGHYFEREGVRVFDQFKGRYGAMLQTEIHVHPDGEHIAVVYRGTGQDFLAPVANAKASDLPPMPRKTLAGGDPESCPECGAAWNGLECYECEYREAVRHE